MPKRKKYPKLPNGYGSIKYLGKGRRNPYAVHPPTEDYNLNGSPITPKALCYTNTWVKGFAVLTAYKAGTYTPGYELTLNFDDTGDTEGIMYKIMADYNQIRRKELNTPEDKTFAEVYKEFYFDKYEREKSRKFSQSTIDATKAAFKHCKALHDKSFQNIRLRELQDVIDKCTLKHSSLELIQTLFKQMYDFAIKNDLCDKDYSAFIKINRPDDDESGTPFTEDELKKLWKNKEDRYIELALIMCYSGYRISECKAIDVHLEKSAFSGGLKTEAGRDRIVPIHSAILPLVKKRLQRDGHLLKSTSNSYRRGLARRMKRLGMEHTPHDCRHTFSMLCEKYGVRENDRKRMMGHSFGKDITNSVYGHRSLEDLRSEIEKIQVCY